jgi:hypothetical protein
MALPYNVISMTDTESFSFDEQQMWRDRGLLPREGDYTEPLPMPEVRHIDLASDLIDFLHVYGFTETDGMKNMRAQILQLLEGKTLEQATAANLLPAFGEQLNAYQTAITDSFPQRRPTNDIVTMVMTAHLFHELHWDGEAQRELGEAIILSDKIQQDVGPLCDLLERQLQLSATDSTVDEVIDMVEADFHLE